ncbi:copper amine oxidase N-terminal domain-containing protein [Heliobacterium chlorum]|uniref:Copper amine oxidase N-terminal domain-containing protein n=2 Tax=Heliobacterium chlorum TaxID=2698 RepID=A0ABR7T120_HELCL|nr:copper amine oxidase N-terminal domain-containing protein [Heliobacterium chlorum]MBC9784490.1 copper amine oxidase N-terminal domain-containing protein [Heliobacterium chlorum]
MAAPAFAMTNNNVSVVTTISDTADGVNLGTLLMKEDSDFTDDLKTGKSFTISLPSGIKFVDTDPAKMIQFKDLINNKTVAGDATTVSVSGDYTVTVTLPDEVVGTFEYANQQAIYFTPNIKVDGFDGGDIEVSVDGMESGATSGKYVVGRVASGDKTTASVVKVETIGDGGKEVGGIIRIEERYAGSLGDIGADSLLFKVKLPSNFKWVTNGVKNGDGTNTTEITGIAGYKGGNLSISKLDADDNELDVYGTINYAAGQDRGIIEIHPVISPESDAKFGDVEASIDGKAADIDDTDQIIATYAEFGAEVKATEDVKDVMAGRQDEELAKIRIKENIAGSFVDGRKIRVDFPSWVKVTDASFSKGDARATKPASVGEDSYYEFTYNAPAGGTKAEMEIQFKVSAKANASGDIKATVSGKAGAEGEAILGKAYCPVAVTSDSKEVRVGIKEQALGDIYVTETKAGTINDENGYELNFELPDDVEWSDTPKVEVVEGNLDIDEDNISKDGNVVTVPVKSASTKAAKIKISGAKIDLNRSVAEGNIEMKVKGTAVAENDKSAGNPSLLENGEFDQSWAAKGVVAKVVTPAPGEQQRTAVFKIGDAKMTIGGVEVALDAAPYIKNDRTYVPLRYVAKAVGVEDNNIVYNAADRSVVLLKGDRAVKLTVGSTEMSINGIPVSMDVAPEIVEPGRIMLPVRWVAQALGVTLNWDAATQTVTCN